MQPIGARAHRDDCAPRGVDDREHADSADGAEAARIDALAAREVWKAIGVHDRIGVTEEDVPHCRWHDGFTPDVEAYLDRFLVGTTGGRSTDILRSRYQIADRDKWIPWTAPALK